MSFSTGIIAHLIVGRKPEQYLGAVLESIADVCDHVVINDNSGQTRSQNSLVVLDSRIAHSGGLTLVRSSFTDFATARNCCLDATPSQFANAWCLFVDADEVHGEELSTMAALLPHLPDDVQAVDGYSRFFVGSFSWWTELQRTRCFIRLSPTMRWSGKIHEQLAPVGRRIALPAQWCQYGHVVLPHEEAEKSLLYASLGPGRAPTEAQLSRANAASVWAHLLRRAHRFHGAHPPAMTAVIERLKLERAQLFAAVDVLAGRRTRADSMRNALRQVNARRLVAWRAAEAHLRWRWPAHARYQWHQSARTGAVRVDAGLDGAFAKQTSR